MEYYVSINNEKRGPYTLEELRSRGITAETLVMAEGSGQWIPAWQVSNLSSVINGQQPDAPQAETAPNEEPVAQPLAEEPQANRQPSATTPKKHSYGGYLLALLIAAIIGGTMVFTCPGKEAHTQKLASLVNNSVEEVIKEHTQSDNSLVGKGIQMMSSMLVGKVIDTVVDNMVSVDNYAVCSLGKVHYEGKDHIVSVGMLGQVLTVNKDKVKDIAEKYYADFQQQAEDTVRDQLQENIVDPIKEQILDPLKDAAKDIIGGILNDLIGGGSTDNED